MEPRFAWIERSHYHCATPAVGGADQRTYRFQRPSAGGLTRYTGGPLLDFDDVAHLLEADLDLANPIFGFRASRSTTLVFGPPDLTKFF